MKQINRLLLALILLVTGAPALHAADVRIIDVVAITWPGAPTPSVSVDDVAKSVSNEVNQRWNFLAQNWPDGLNFQIGSVQQSPISMIVPLICDGTESSAYMRDARRAFYNKYPSSDYSSHYLVLLSPTPRPNCIWEGKSLIGDAATPGGLIILKNNASGFILSHEIGHTLGLGHTNLVRCASGGGDGAWSGCSAVEYGGAVDLMSNVDVKGPLNTYHQWRMGIIKNSDITQVWKSQSVDLKYTNSPSGTRAIFIRDGKQTYWIEYRKAADGYSPGLAIYRTDPPPASSIVSPNAADAADAPSTAVTTDVWLLNLDAFFYYSSTVYSGSPILPIGQTFLDSSGNVTLTATQKDADTLTVNISRKPDLNAPPTPILSNPANWTSPDAELIQPGYEDQESVIDKFQISVNGKILDISGSASNSWYPTYLSPLVPTKSVRLRDLPEGNYILKIRGVDIFGNVSEWSNSANISIDRGAPIVTSNFQIDSVTNNGSSFTWTGASDPGSGICSVQVANEDGFIVARNDRTIGTDAPPILNFLGLPEGKAQLFDCRGNGVEGNLSSELNNIVLSSGRMSGKIKAIGDTYQCVGTCNFSYQVSGDIEIRLGKGTGSIYLNSKLIGNYKSENGPIRLNIGKSKNVLRISGSNFSLQNLTSYAIKWTQTGLVSRKVPIVDPSLVDQNQLSLSKYGFQINDFDQLYQLLPIARGTTLLDATLDLCNGDFPSEKTRILRRQVAGYKTGNSYDFLSTETVKYKDAKSALSSMTDVENAIAKCKVNGGYTGSQGEMVKYSFDDSLKFSNNSTTLSRAVLTQIDDSSGTRWLLAFFQVKDDLASHMYVVKAQKFTDLEIQRWKKVANLLAIRLSTYSPLELSA